MGITSATVILLQWQSTLFCFSGKVLSYLPQKFYFSGKVLYFTSVAKYFILLQWQSTFLLALEILLQWQSSFLLALEVLLQWQNTFLLALNRCFTSVTKYLYFASVAKYFLACLRSFASMEKCFFLFYLCRIASLANLFLNSKESFPISNFVTNLK